jgi:DNA-directed RNA polymerase specialized sigma24 family protein
MNSSQPIETGLGPDEAAVTRWLTELRQGDEAAAGRLWDHLYRRLLLLAEREMARKAPKGFDGEDVALSAFHTLCQSLQQGRYGDVENRYELWQLLMVITINKARRRVRDENRLRRGGGLTRRDDAGEFLGSLVTPEPDPQAVSMAREECQRLIESLGSRDLQMVVLLKAEGCTDEQVAESLGCTRRTVQRRLTLIRDLWVEEIPHD